MSAQPVFLIVGASLAGAKAAEELRTQGFDGRVVLIGAEPERPYERPPLTKDYLRGESEREKAYVHPDVLALGAELAAQPAGYADLPQARKVAGLSAAEQRLVAFLSPAGTKPPAPH